jgi:hypothetical protein
MNPKQFILTTTNLKFIPQSLTAHDELEYGLVEMLDKRRLAVLSSSKPTKINHFVGERIEFGDQTLMLCNLSMHNAANLRANLPWLQPRLLGLQTSAGMGDRLGNATPGHVCAVKSVGGNIAPIFAQQSMREMARTIRTPQQVMDDATWGIFQENWRDGVGADADHLKTFEDIDLCLTAGFTFFTIDPGDFVDNRAESAGTGDLKVYVHKLPKKLQVKANGLLDKTFKIENIKIHFDENTLLKAMAKYGNAVDHVYKMYRHLKKQAGSHAFELEVSVDETEQPTSLAEHFYIAHELQRLDVKWVSLAPRYIGRFEKGVDYIGDIKQFEADLAGHAAVARHFGPYKLSLHSGSDKFSIYPAAMRQTQGLVHLKTAGTSYLEALHTIAEIDQDFFEEIYRFARDRYVEDRKSYHVSADLKKAPLPENVEDWSKLLEQFDAREILHVTFGSVLTQKSSEGSFLFYDRLMKLLQENPTAYAINLKNHFVRHLKPFAH